MRISDWSSDVCSSDLEEGKPGRQARKNGSSPMNFGLSDEQQMIVDTVRSFVEKELYPHEAMVERERAVPRELGLEIARKCRDIGFFAANLPEAVGGGGLGHLDFTLLERELGRASKALTVFFRSEE